MIDPTQAATAVTGARGRPGILFRGITIGIGLTFSRKQFPVSGTDCNEDSDRNLEVTAGPRCNPA